VKILNNGQPNAFHLLRILALTRSDTESRNREAPFERVFFSVEVRTKMARQVADCRRDDPGSVSFIISRLKRSQSVKGTRTPLDTRLSRPRFAFHGEPKLPVKWSIRPTPSFRLLLSQFAVFFLSPATLLDKKSGMRSVQSPVMNPPRLSPLFK